MDSRYLILYIYIIIFSNFLVLLNSEQNVQNTTSHNNVAAKKPKQKTNPFPKTCGYQNVTSRARIYGGTEADLGEFPWIARLYHKDKRNKKTFGCSGFLITAKFVLTAGHCLQSENVDTMGPIYEVQLGEHNIETKIDCTSKAKKCADPPQLIRVKKTIVHPSYNMNSSQHHHDIGLIQLKRAANFSNFVSPICLLNKLDFNPFEYWISGWGSTGPNRLTSPIKMKVSLRPFSHSNCTAKYKQINIKVTKNQICAGGMKNKDSCTGDSGGPLMLVKNSSHWFSAGVVSYGLGCGKKGWPGVYTNITRYIDWIEGIVTGQETKKVTKKAISKKSSKSSDTPLKIDVRSIKLH